MISKKGQTKEIMEFMILVIGVVVLISISHVLFANFTPKLLDIFTRYHQFERISDMSITFYYAKVNGTERTLAQLVGDRIANGKNPVDYGPGFGTIDVDSLVKNFFDAYFEKNWRLEIGVPKIGVLSPPTTSIKFTAGYSVPNEINRLQVFEMLTPIPSEKSEVLSGYLYVW